MNSPWSNPPEAEPAKDHLIVELPEQAGDLEELKLEELDEREREQLSGVMRELARVVPADVLKKYRYYRGTREQAEERERRGSHMGERLRPGPGQTLLEALLHFELETLKKLLAAREARIQELKDAVTALGGDPGDRLGDVKLVREGTTKQ